MTARDSLFDVVLLPTLVGAGLGFAVRGRDGVVPGAIFGALALPVYAALRGPVRNAPPELDPYIASTSIASADRTFTGVEDAIFSEGML